MTEHEDAQLLVGGVSETIDVNANVAKYVAFDGYSHFDAVALHLETQLGDFAAHILSEGTTVVLEVTPRAFSSLNKFEMYIC